MFLIYELSPPCGKGKINPYDQGQYNIDKIYSKRVLENAYILSQAQKKDDDPTKENQIYRTEFHGDVFWVNVTKGLVLKDTRTAAMISQNEIPLYNGLKVHFKDVLKQIVKNAFDSIGKPILKT